MTEGHSPPIGGSVVHLSDTRTTLVDEVLERPRFTLAWPSDRPLDSVSAAILCADGKVRAVGRLAKGPRVTSFERRLTIDSIVQVEPVAVSEILKLLQGKTVTPIRKSFDLEGRIPPGSWKSLLSVLGTHFPEIANGVSSLAVRTPAWLLKRSSISTLIAEERDAVCVALDLGGVERGALRWTPPGEPAPFLRGLESTTVGEDTIIQNDMSVFGDWKVVAKYSVGGALFESGGHRVTVLNVNRTPLEAALGVDLIYYNHDFGAYLLVQYKRLAEEGSGTARRLVYRPTRDKSFASEMKRMTEVGSWSGGEAAVLRNYRLNAGPCYVKFCSPKADRHLVELSKGMYLPLSYLALFLSSPECRGAKAGKLVSFGNIRRHLTNTQFTELCQNGWLGSRAATTGRLTELMRGGLRRSRSVMLAVGSRIPGDTGTSDDMADSECEESFADWPPESTGSRRPRGAPRRPSYRARHQQRSPAESASLPLTHCDPGPGRSRSGLRALRPFCP